MSRFRSTITTACLAIALLVVVPGSAVAQYGAALDSVHAQREAAGGRLAQSAIDWGRDALSWLQSIFAADHGHIVPIPPPDPLAPTEPTPSDSPEDPTLPGYTAP